MMKIRTVFFLTLLTLGASQAAAADTTTLRVLAASSLTDALPRLIEAFRKTHADVEFQPSFDASSRLARQLEAGAPAELFFSADEEWMDFAATKGLLAPDTRRDVVGNELVVVVPAAQPKPPKTPAELGEERFKKIALAGENVPVAKYARAAFEKLGAWKAIEPKLLRADNVRASLNWVVLGEADAGIVYRTDANSKVKVAFAVDPKSHPPIRYPAAALKSADAAQLREAARAFLDFCVSRAARPLWRGQGFKAL